MVFATSIGTSLDRHNVLGLDHLAFHIDSASDLRDWGARFARLGLLCSPITESPWGLHLNVRGPENLAIELLVMKADALEAMFGPVGTAQERLRVLGS